MEYNKKKYNSFWETRDLIILVGFLAKHTVLSSDILVLVDPRVILKVIPSN